MILETAKTLIIGLFQVAKIFLIPLLIVFAVFLLLIFINIGIEMAKGRRFKKGAHVTLKKRNALLKLFLDAPKQYVTDLFNKEPDFFRYQGCIVYEGRQGYGKTITMVHDAMMMQLEYPLAKCITNLNYTKQDVALNHWRQLINYKNGKKGVIVCIDEMQNWFSSNQSKNFPPEMLEVITQNRKNRRVVMGTSQNFYLLAKSIRSQATEVRSCNTFWGCITFVRKKEPILDSEGNVKEWKHRGWYFYVHDAELRACYDTYKTIESLAKSGFTAKDKDITVTTVVNAK